MRGGGDLPVLLSSLSKGCRTLCDALDAVHDPLHTVRMTLRSCVDDLRGSDSAVSEAVRYTEKLGGLEDSADVSARAQAKLARNREKLQRSTLYTNSAFAHNLFEPLEQLNDNSIPGTNGVWLAQ